MSSPTPENEQLAFEGLLVSVDSVAMFYNYAKELEQVLPELLTTLTKDGADCKASLSDQQALAKQLAGAFSSRATAAAAATAGWTSNADSRFFVRFC